MRLHAAASNRIFINIELWCTEPWVKKKKHRFRALLPHDLADLQARIIAAVKYIGAIMMTRVCGKNLNIVSMCAVSPMVHTSINVCRVTHGAHIEHL